MFLSEGFLKTASELLRPMCKVFGIKYFLLLWERFVTGFTLYLSRSSPKIREIRIIRDLDNDPEDWDEA